MTDDEREIEIASMGQQITDAYQAGDQRKAQNLFALQAALIGGRSVEQIARMEAKIFNDGNGGTRSADSLPAGTPSPIHARNAQIDARKENSNG